MIITAATVAHVALASDAINSTVGYLVALFTVGELRDRRTSGLVALVSAVLVGTLLTVRGTLPAALSGLVQTELAILATWVLGTWARDRRRQVETAEERAARLELEREQRDRQAVAEERERIARELHDVVTHHVSVIVIQAGAAERALDRRPADARTAIKAIDATARQALADMRRMLGILAAGARRPRTAPTRDDRPHADARASTGSASSSSRSARPGRRSSCPSTASAGRSTPASSCRPTGSSRRP